jgi:hypothetical protein
VTAFLGAVPSATPNNLTNTNLDIALPASAAEDVLVIEAFWSTAGTGVDPIPSLPGWTEQLRLALTFGSGATGGAVYTAPGGLAGPAALTWTNPASCIAIAKAYSGVDQADPFLDKIMRVKADGTATYSVPLTVTDDAWLSTVFAQRTSGVWSNATDTQRGTAVLGGLSYYSQDSAADVAPGVQTRTITGPVTTNGIECAYTLRAANIAPPDEAPLAAWNGSAWVPADLKVWDGTNWIDAPPKVWDGSSWIV